METFLYSSVTKDGFKYWEGLCPDGMGRMCEIIWALETIEIGSEKVGFL